MISPKVYSKEWIDGVRGKLDPTLTEKMIMALTLV